MFKSGCYELGTEPCSRSSPIAIACNNAEKGHDGNPVVGLANLILHKVRERRLHIIGNGDVNALGARKLHVVGWSDLYAAINSRSEQLAIIEGVIDMRAPSALEVAYDPRVKIVAG